mgnify:CR=1 FL=1
MKKFLLLLTIGILTLVSCNPKIDYSKFVPDEVNMFAKNFVLKLQKGNVDSCLSFVLPEIRNDTARVFLITTHEAINNFSLDSCNIISSRKSTLIGDEKIINYLIDYEYPLTDKFLYLSIGVQEQNEHLFITALNVTLEKTSFSSQNKLSLKHTGIKHYLFLTLSIFVPIFIIVTMLVAIRTKMKMKWLWILVILFGFTKFSINWTTGQIGFSLINFSILGFGIIKSGNVAPWILSFSIPIGAILFWLLIRKNETNTAITDKPDEILKDE